MTFPHVSGYQLVNRLGQGAFGTVYEALWNENFICALKLLEEGTWHRDYLADVLERLMELELPRGLLPVYAFDLEGETPHLSMALLPPGAVTFDHLVGQVTLDEAWALLAQLGESLAWLHQNGLVHAGVTGGNVFVVADEQGEPKTLLTDVGQAWLGGGTMERLHDQAPYVPPERWLDPEQVLQKGHAERWDVYAFGVLAWRLLNGRWPRANKLFDRVLASRGEKLTIDPPAFAEWLTKERPPTSRDQPRDAAGQRARQMVLQCVALNPAERPVSMTEVAQALRELLAARASTVQASSPRVESTDSKIVCLLPNKEQSENEVALLAVAEELPEALVAEPEPEALPNSQLESDPKPSLATTSIKPDFSEIFSLPGENILTDSEHEIARASASDLADATLAMPARPSTKTMPFPNPPESVLSSIAAAAVVSSSGTGRRFGLAASVVLGLGGIWYGLEKRSQAVDAQHEAAEAVLAAQQARSSAKAAADRIQTLEAEQASQQLEKLSTARDEWAGLVATVLAARPVEPAALTAWKAAAEPVAERLKAALAAAELEPSLVVASMEPRWKLAEMYEGLALSEEALPLLEHLTRDLAATAATAAPHDETRGLLTARVSSRRGAILLESHHPMEAAPLLQEASAAYEGWLTSHSDRHEIAREYAVNSLLEGCALHERAQPELARTALARVSGLLGKPDDGGFLPEDHFTLTDSLLKLAEIDSASGQLEPAIELHMQAVRLLVAYDQANRQSVPCRRRLADGYFGLGRLLTKNGTPRDASVAFSEAVKLLTELSKETPTEPDYRLQLALTYNEVAQLIRTSRPNAAGAKEALDYQNGSVTILRNLNEANTLNNLFRRQLAAALVLNAELQELAGDSKTGLANHSEALALIEELLGETSLTENDRRECRRLSARAWTALGGMQEKAGRKEDAISSLNKALEAWSGFAADDPVADQIVASTRERLRKLKPES